jgi:hypothetical protein
MNVISTQRIIAESYGLFGCCLILLLRDKASKRDEMTTVSHLKREIRLTTHNTRTAKFSFNVALKTPRLLCKAKPVNTI